MNSVLFSPTASSCRRESSCGREILTKSWWSFFFYIKLKTETVSTDTSWSLWVTHSRMQELIQLRNVRAAVRPQMEIWQANGARPDADTGSVQPRDRDTSAAKTRQLGTALTLRTEVRGKTFPGPEVCVDNVYVTFSARWPARSAAASPAFTHKTPKLALNSSFRRFGWVEGNKMINNTTTMLPECLIGLVLGWLCRIQVIFRDAKEPKRK